MTLRTALNTEYDELTYDEIHNLREDDVSARVPRDVVVEIFKHLPTKDLLSMECTCRSFRYLIGSTEGLIENSLKIQYPNIQILGPKSWGTAAECEALGIVPTGAPEVGIKELARVVSKFYQEIQEGASVTVFPMLQKLTIRKLLEFAQKGPNPVLIEYVWPMILEEIKDIPVSRTYLAVMTTGLFIGSRGQSFNQQYALCQKNGGKMPELIDILAQSILRSKYFGERVPLPEPNDILTMYSRSVSFIGKWPLVGGFPVSGLFAGEDHLDPKIIGVVGLKKFEAPLPLTSGT